MVMISKNKVDLFLLNIENCFWNHISLVLVNIHTVKVI